MAKLILPSGTYALEDLTDKQSLNHPHSFFISGGGYLCNHSPKRHVVNDEPLPRRATILGLASAITEDVAAGIVEPYSQTIAGTGGKTVSGFKHYNVQEEDVNDPERNIWPYFKRATDSLHSLIRSHGYEPQHCLILKIEK